MKFCLLLLSSAVGCCVACSRLPAPTPAPAQSYDEASAALMRKVAPHVVGNWTLAEVHVQFKPGFYFFGPQRFPRDTVMQQFAKLAIAPAQPSRSSPADPRYPDFEGQLTYRGKIYPVYFSLLAAPDRVVRNEGPLAHFLLEYNFPVGSHPTEVEEQFLQNIGLIEDNFSLELDSVRHTMTWRGLNRSIEHVELRR